MTTFFRFLLRGMYLVALLPVAATAGGPGAGASEINASCPGLLERQVFEVKAVAPESKDGEVRADVVRYRLDALKREAARKSLTGAGATPMSVSMIEAIERPRLTDEANGKKAEKLASMEEVALTGLVQWMENRAAAEVRLWVVDTLQSRLCHDDGAYFPETCQVLDTNDEVLSVAYAGDAIVRGLRNDLPRVPACAIHNRIGSPIGYQLISIYTQFTDGANLDSLLYGLAQAPGGNTPGASVSREHARLLLPVFAYAAMLDAMPFSKNDAKFALDVFNARFETYRAAANLCIEGACGPQLDMSDMLATLELVEKKRNRVADIVAKLKELKDKESELEPKLEQQLQWFRELGLAMSELLGSVASGVRPREADTELAIHFSQQLNTANRYMGMLLRAHNAVERREYARALIELVPFTTCVADPKATEDCKAIIDNAQAGEYDWLLRSAYTAALLADADDADDFEETLDALASPVGAYRRRHYAPMWSVNAYLGADVSHNRVRVYGDNTSDIKDDYLSVEVFAPVGVTRTWQECWWDWMGACGAHLQLLNVGVLAGDYRGRIQGNGYTLDSETETTFRSVFSPGAYLVFSPFPRAPVTFGLGYQRGPYHYKTGTLANGADATADRTWAATAFVAVDLVIFGF